MVRIRIISDLHLHSKHSRATSKDMDLDSLEKWGKIKGLNLLGTGDFTHPEWIKELKSKLSGDETGIYKTAGGMNFILQTEVSMIYTDQGKGRRVHNVILAPDLDSVDQITDYFKSKGRIDYDGRPIFKISCPELVENMMQINKDIEVIPAHIWTPYFGLLGSKTGFDSVEEAFRDQAKNIHALETGLSSDPPMNWRLSQLDKYSLVSSSDSHSFWPWRIGREAIIFEMEELSYKNIINALRTKQGLWGTIEVDPAYGKYHYDGHRNCNVCFSPKETAAANGICPKCGKPMTIGVENRVEELADRKEGDKPEDAKKFMRLIPLQEIISTIMGAGIATKKVWAVADSLMKQFGSELNVLLKAPEDEIRRFADAKIAEAIMKNRKGKIKISPGYDGVYGEPVFEGDEKKKIIPEKMKKEAAGTRPANKKLQTGLGRFL